MTHLETDTPDTWVDVYVGVGSNLGHRAGQIRQAFMAFDAHPHIRACRCAPLLETPPEGQPQPTFINTAFHLQTLLSPKQLLAVCHHIERQMGRNMAPAIRLGPRPIDLDILKFADWQITSPCLTIPHPGITSRPFVREPLAALH